MDRTKRTIAISAVLIASVTMLTVGLYLKAMNADTDAPQAEMMEMDMIEQSDIPGELAAQPDAELSEQEIDAILKEIMDSGELEMSEEIEVDETE